MASDCLNSLAGNPVGHRTFAEIVRIVARPNECRHCGNGHRGGRLCLAADQERRDLNSFRRRRVW